MKRTYQPKKRQEQKEHGFMKRMKTKAGRKVLKSRREKGRKKFHSGIRTPSRPCPNSLIPVYCRRT